jgi:hypothetical protein
MSSDRGSKTNAHLMTSRENFAFSRPSSKIARMSSPGFRWCVRELVRAALCTVSSQTNACRALLVISETAIPVALVMDFRALQVASNGLGWPTVFHSFGLGATVSGAFRCIMCPVNFVTHRPNFVTHRDEGGGQLNTLRTLQNEGARSLSKRVRFPAPDHTPG